VGDPNRHGALADRRGKATRGGELRQAEFRVLRTEPKGKLPLVAACVDGPKVKPRKFLQETGCTVAVVGIQGAGNRVNSAVDEHLSPQKPSGLVEAPGRRFTGFFCRQLEWSANEVADLEFRKKNGGRKRDSERNWKRSARQNAWKFRDELGNIRRQNAKGIPLKIPHVPEGIVASCAQPRGVALGRAFQDLEEQKAGPQPFEVFQGEHRLSVTDAQVYQETYSFGREQRAPIFPY
jgi:hypothetical protein